MRHLDQLPAELLRRRLAGDDFTTLARELNYADAAAAAAALAQALADAEPLEPTARHQADQRTLDELQYAIWDSAVGGDLDAILTALAIHDARSRRRGLDVRARLEPAGPAVDPATVTAAELDELLALVAESGVDAREAGPEFEGRRSLETTTKRCIVRGERTDQGGKA
ncbi:hypothetical protein [Streptomyces javensis]|uniref:Uncharacterized protein n=1 Tax=Streptomyces javensis TaxID=114698 RepID=A0ABS0R6P9_9ACTN|nr:hypothetical protein [Streptomyces javensis]MBI0313039.1 hypothetical protein [Streptomyces javensis]